MFSGNFYPFELRIQMPVSCHLASPSLFCAPSVTKSSNPVPLAQSLSSLPARQHPLLSSPHTHTPMNKKDPLMDPNWQDPNWQDHFPASVVHAQKFQMGLPATLGDTDSVKAICILQRMTCRGTPCSGTVSSGVRLGNRGRNAGG